MLERRYLAAVTTGGAAVGATAVVPGIGTGVTLALSGVETVGFLEATTLFAQSVAEVHGIAGRESRSGARARAHADARQGRHRPGRPARRAGDGQGPDARPLLGRADHQDAPPRRARSARRPAQDLLHPPVRGEGQRLVSSARRCRSASAPSSAARATTSSGAACSSTRAAPSDCRPLMLPPDLEPRPGATPLERATTYGLRRAGSAVVGGVRKGATSVGATGRKVGGALTPRRRSKKDGALEDHVPVAEDEPPAHD